MFSLLAQSPASGEVSWVSARSFWGWFELHRLQGFQGRHDPVLLNLK
jgi:hypothetical protein